jgi:hypothetical protein
VNLGERQVQVCALEHDAASGRSEHGIGISRTILL